MLKFRITYMVLLALSLVGCSSTSESVIQEYVLPKEAKVDALPSQLPKDTIIKLREIIVSDYLQDVKIVIVNPNGQVHKASRHLWAEPLHSQLENLTQIRLAQRLPNVAWMSPNLSSDEMPELEVTVTQFHCDEDGLITVSGQWALWNADRRLVIQSPFNVKGKLSQGGYLAMTKQLSATWLENVVDDIAKQLATLHQLKKES